MFKKKKLVDLAPYEHRVLGYGVCVCYDKSKFKKAVNYVCALHEGPWGMTVKHAG